MLLVKKIIQSKAKVEKDEDPEALPRVLIVAEGPN